MHVDGDDARWSPGVPKIYDTVHLEGACHGFVRHARLYYGVPFSFKSIMYVRTILFYYEQTL